jgi:hypothetical protein
VVIRGASRSLPGPDGHGNETVRAGRSGTFWPFGTEGAQRRFEDGSTRRTKAA